MEATSSMTMMSTIPNIITSSPSGGRFDFDDGGTYCGGWQDGKAHGHGVCTGPKNVGEYSGSWNFGFEMSGVYKWTNGAVYEGRWQNGKRHGVGVEYNGKWIYKGEWSQGLKGRYGVKASSNSAVKYEGTWANGLQDGYGSETYSDGGYYQGQMCRGLRHGYGVRKSAPYGDSQLNNPSKNGPLTGGFSSSSSAKLLLHSNSMQSTGSAADLSPSGAFGGGGLGDDDSPKPEDGFKPNIDRTLVSKNGFVLVAKPLDVPMPQSSGNGKLLGVDSGGGKRRSSLTKLAHSARIPNQTSSLLRGLRLKKQKSTSDLDVLGGGGGKSRSGASSGQQQDSDLPIVPFTLSPEELDITDPTTVETYTGEWKHDKRNGHGVCDRSDGLKYEGQWHNDMKSGYGVTTFKDGTKEEGKYKNNILIVDSKVKRFFQLGGSNIRQRIDDAVKMALQAQTMALKKAEIADTRAATARDKADQAMTAAIEADRDSQFAYSTARQYSNDSQQQQQQQQQMMSGGANNFMFSQNQMMNMNLMDQQQQQQQHPFLPQSLNMATSPLQMRRISQNQRTNFNPNQQQQQQQFNTSNPNQNQFQQQQQQQVFNIQDQQNQQQAASQNPQQKQQQQQYLDQVKPFNGRRGSFRGGSQHSPGGPRSLGGPGSGGTGAGGGPNHLSAINRQSSTDPFSDLFDHYRSSGPSGYMGVSGSTGPSGLRSRRPMLGKQTSLDYNHLRQQSVPRHLGGSNYSSATNNGTRMRRFRMSSLDHADENQPPTRPSIRMSQESINQQDLMQQQQFRHLVTSGEDPERLSSSLAHQQQAAEDQLYMQQQQQQQLADQQHQRNHQNDPTPTPTSSSYILPHSSAAGSSYNVSNQTPSPSKDLTGGAYQSAGGDYNQQQQTATSYAHQMMQHQQQQFNNNRDVRSLADEQLYLAGDRRRYYGRDGPLDHGGEYSNYDFSITSEPRPSQRCMRRTASLSRATPLASSPINGGGGGGRDSARLRASLMDTRGSLGGLSSATTTMRQQHGANLFQQQQQQHQPMISISPSGAPDLQQQQTQPGGGGGGGGGGDFGGLLANSNTAHGQHVMMMTMNHLTPNTSCNSSLTSGASSVSQHNRKPSLQVRYDPIQMGGLMSREEVAALSHAQREQKRHEFELAEQRAKRPMLHLYLTLKEFITRHQLILSVLLVNICLMKMFADLIV